MKPTLRPDELAAIARTTVEQPELVATLADGTRVTRGNRDELLARFRAGELTRLSVQATVYRQFRTSVPLPLAEQSKANANFVRFADVDLPRLATSFRGQPLLRDHQPGQLAVGGTITESKLVESEALWTIVQQLDVVKPWAIEGILDGTIRSFSIGWRPRSRLRGAYQASMFCSVCDDLFWSRSCPHMPGQVVQLEGGPRVIAELEWRQVRGQETSTVPFAAVHGTRVDDVRALAQLASSKGNTTMDLTELAALLGLQAEASVDALCTAVTALKDRDQTRDRELATLRSRNLELSQKVDAAEAEVAEARQSLAQQQVESIVNEALDSGAVAPGGEVEAQLRDLALSDPDRAKAFVAELAKRPATPVGQPRQQPIGTAPHAGTPQDKASSDQVPGSALTYGHLAGQLKPADLQAAKNCSLSPAEYVRINYDWLSSEYSGWPAKEAD